MLLGLLAALSHLNSEGPGTSLVVSSGDDSVLGVEDSPGWDISGVVLVASSEGELEGESCVTGGEGVYDLPVGTEDQSDQKTEKDGSH